MLRIHGVVRHDADAPARLHALEHREAVEHLCGREGDVSRRRFRLTTDRGTDCAVSLDRDEVLSDGALLFLDDERAIVIRVGEPKTWRLRPKTPEAALRLGWNAGNLHWRVSFDGADLVVLLDAPLADYRARIVPLFAEDLIEEIDA